jgi:protein-arginine kinase activator protein McsA|tara:strand:- start:419 stop:673 length:255 start_codon:yes stop_codon:yes gene_type:complete
LADNINDNYNEFINDLTNKIYKLILKQYGDKYPLNLNLDEEEMLVGELARLHTILNALEEREDYEQCIIVRDKIKKLEEKLNEY